MLLTQLLAVTLVTNLSGLLLRWFLANAVLADEVGTTAIGSVTEETLAAEDAATLPGNVGIQWQKSVVGESCWRSGYILAPIEIATALVGMAESVGQCTDSETRLSDNADL